MNDLQIRTMWGGTNCGWEARESVCSSGVLITMWNSDKFMCSINWHMDGTVIINGFWGRESVNCYIINVYPPNLLNERKELLDRLAVTINQYSDSRLCVVGDFNAIRYVAERSGVMEAVNRR